MSDLDPEGRRLPIKLDSTSNGEFVPIPLDSTLTRATALASERASALSRGKRRGTRDATTPAKRRYVGMSPSYSRRTLLSAGLVLPLLALPGCAMRLRDLPNLEPAIRRLLTLSSQRAFARVLTDQGFFRDEVTRIQPPPQLGGSTLTATLAVALGTRAVQDRLIRVVNQAAEEGARRAAPVVYASIRDMTIADASSIARGGPTAATAYLERSMGERIFDAIFPGVGEALRLAENGVVQRALQYATGINFPGLQADVTRKTAAALYRAIGREEAAIRADPGSAGDPALAALFAVLR